MPRVIARVNNPKNEWLFNENWGVDVSVSTPHLITALVEEAVSVGRLVRLLQFEGGRARLVEVTLADDVAGRSTRRSRSSTSPATPPIVAVVREEHVVVPRGDTVLRGGRRGARAGDRRLRGRRPPAPHRHLTRAWSGRQGSSL